MTARLAKKHRKTLEKVFRPQRRKAPGVTYREMVGLLKALGAEIDDTREGSRVSAQLPNGSVLVFHNPHRTSGVFDGGATADIREWLRANGIEL